jgi:hypothetical protein
MLNETLKDVTMLGTMQKTKKRKNLKAENDLFHWKQENH